MSVCPSACISPALNGRTSVWNFMWRNSMKICRENSNFIKTWPEYRAFYMETYVRLCCCRLLYVTTKECVHKRWSNVFWRSWDHLSLEQRYKHPTRCNNFRLLIFLLVYLNLLYMFRATNSPIFRSTFDFIYSFGTMHRYCCRPVTRLRWNFSLIIGRQQEPQPYYRSAAICCRPVIRLRFHLNLVTGRQQFVVSSWWWAHGCQKHVEQLLEEK